VIGKVREKLSVNKYGTQNFDSERFNVKKLSELKVRKQYQIKISKRILTLENLVIERT
jgi:hypothetical protein